MMPCTPGAVLKSAVDAAVQEVCEQTATKTLDTVAHEFLTTLHGDEDGFAVYKWHCDPILTMAGPVALDLRVTLRCPHGEHLHRQYLVTPDADGAGWAKQVLAECKTNCTAPSHIGGPMWISQPPHHPMAVTYTYPSGTPGEALTTLFPALNAHRGCPAYGLPMLNGTTHCRIEGSHPVANLIMHLNDHHAWTRERIADWLETLDVDLTLQPASQGD